jgi:hypothetical protein
MRDYRAHVIGHDGHIQKRFEFNCSNRKPRTRQIPKQNWDPRQHRRQTPSKRRNSKNVADCGLWETAGAKHPLCA